MAGSNRGTRGDSDEAVAAGDSIVFDRAAGYYDRTRGYPAGVGEQVAELLCRAGGLGPGSRVLEVGVGTGRIALPLAARVGCVAGVDRSRPMLGRLQAKQCGEPALPVIADALQLPFANACFDAVVAVHVFHLLPGWRQALREISRVLVAGGRLLEAEDSQLLPELWTEASASASAPTPQNVGVARGVLDFPLRAGFVRVAETLTLRYPVRLELSTFLREIEQRVWSATWRLSDADHARLLDAMRAAVGARYGSLDAVLELERELSVRVYAPS